MQEILANKESPKNVVSLDGCAFLTDKIYAYWYDREIRVLVACGGRYYWTSLKLFSEGSYGGTSGYSSAKDAVAAYINFCNDDGKKRVFIFKDQCELIQWAETQ